MKKILILCLFLFGCDEESVYGCTDSTACNFNPGANIFDNSCLYVEKNVCNNCTSDFNCILGQWEFLEYTSTPSTLTDECLTWFDVETHENALSDWEPNINSDGTIMLKEENVYWDWTANLDTLFLDFNNEVDMYLIMSFNSTNNLILSTDMIATDDEGTVVCDFTSHATFSKQ